MEPPLSVCQRLLKNTYISTNVNDSGDENSRGSGSEGTWQVLSASQRASLEKRGFVVVDGFAPAELAAKAYEEVSFVNERVRVYIVDEEQLCYDIAFIGCLALIRLSRFSKWQKHNIGYCTRPGSNYNRKV